MSRKRKILIIVIVIILAIAGLILWLARGHSAELSVDAVSGTDPQLAEPDSETVPTIDIAKPVGWAEGEVPEAAEGLQVRRFAEGLDHPRVLYTLPNGDVLVTLTRAPAEDGGGLVAWIANIFLERAGAAGDSPNQLVLLRDADGDGAAEIRQVLTDALDSPSGIAWHDGTLYIANHDALLSFPYALGDAQLSAEPKKLMDLPPGGGHWMRNIIINPEGTRIYIAVGSVSNIGESGMEVEQGRAAIHEYNLETGNSRLFGTGLRNPNGLAWNPWNEELWTTVNERDMLGSDLVPDYLTNVPVGVNYGWPWVYWKNKVDKRVQEPWPPELAYARRPEYALGPHVAALGLVFSAEGNRMGSAFGQGAFIARHGSWNRNPPSGYDVIYVQFDERGNPQGKPVKVLTGFLKGDSETRGRPTWVAWAGDGALLVSDDTAGIIWRVIDPKAEPAAPIAVYESESLPPRRQLLDDPNDAFREDFSGEVPMPLPGN